MALEDDSSPSHFTVLILQFARLPNSAALVCNDFFSMPCQVLDLSLLLPRWQRLYLNACSFEHSTVCYRLCCCHAFRRPLARISCYYSLQNSLATCIYHLFNNQPTNHSHLVLALTSIYNIYVTSEGPPRETPPHPK
jgi:hypothetical protein